MKILIKLTNRCALLVMFIGLLGICGWLLGIDFLTRLSPQFQSMKFNTALSFLLAGAGLRYRELSSLRIAIGLALSIVGTLTLTEYLLEADYGIDQFILFDKRKVSNFPGRMSPITAVCFVGSGLAISLLNCSKQLFQEIQEILALGVGIVGLTTIVGYLISAEQLYTLPGFTSVALQTGIAFFALSIGIVCTIPDSLFVIALLTWRSHRQIWWSIGLLQLLLIVTGYLAISYSHKLTNDPVDRPKIDLLFGTIIVGIVLGFIVIKRTVSIILHHESELQLKHKALVQNRLDFDRAQEVGQIGWWRLDIIQDILTWSDENYRIFGIPQTTLLTYEKFLNTIYPDDLEYVDSSWKKALAGEPYDIEHRIMVGDQIKWVREKAYLEFDASGTLLGGFGITQDITERKNGMQALAEAEQRLRKQRDELEWIYLNAPIGLCELDLDLRFRRINQLLADINGLPIDAHFGRTVGEIVPALVPNIVEITQKILATGQPVTNHEFCGETEANPGIKRYWNESWYPVFNQQGKISGFGVVVEEITERKRSEEALRNSEERSRLAQSGAHVGVWDWELASGDITWSPELERIYGYAEGTFPGKYENFLIRVYPDDIQDMERRRDEAVNAHKPFDFDFRILLPSGELRWLNCKGAALYGNTGQPERILGVNVDITQRKLAEEALIEADRRKNEFIAMLGHELRNPLTPISSVAQILNTPTISQEKLTECFIILDRNVRHITHLVDDLLDVSRITQGVIKINKQQLELVGLIEEAANSIQSLMEAKKQILHLDLPAKPVYIAGDPVRLTQILSNLLNNSAKYTGEGGRIELIAEVKGTTVTLYIKDNGMGIEAELLTKIFDLFTQSQRGLNRSDGGLGLGLALTKKLVELHGGEITAQSKGADQGSEFIVRLPICVQGAGPEKLQNLQPDHRDNTDSLRILLIDDNPDVVTSLTIWLELVGHQIKSASNGAEGLLIAESFKPEIVLLDIGLPDMDGYEAAQRLRTLPDGGKILIIAMSGYTPYPNAFREKEINFNHYLIKPPQIGQLRQLIADFQRTKTNSANASSDAFYS